MQKIYTLTLLLFCASKIAALDPCTSSSNQAFQLQSVSLNFDGPIPVIGPATGDTILCAYGIANISLLQFIGFITWQQSPDGVNDWDAVPPDEGSHSAYYITPPLTASTYYRAAVFQPGFGVAFSNIVFVEVVPPTPLISATGDALSSSATSGNQWYDANGPIPGATAQQFLALVPGIYHVVVTTDGCVSAPSDPIELLTVSTDGIQQVSQVKIYPNPVGDELYVEVLQLFRSVAYEIINLQGQVIKSGELTGLTLINTNQMTSGFYLLKIHLPGLTEVTKLVKK